MDILKEAGKRFEYMTGIRRHLHENPELSGQETNTLEYIRGELTRMGIPYTDVNNGGILGFIEGKQPGKTLLLRADMDALPIAENPQNLAGPKACVSHVSGVSHACGHDCHTAMLLAEADILNSHREEFFGRVILCFEQGEEGTGNMKYILRYLEETNPIRIDGCYGAHVRWDMDTGTISAEPGPVMAGAYGFEVRIIGVGGHGSRPDLAVSPISCFHAIYGALESLRMREISPYAGLSFSIGKLISGSVMNVIPEDLVFAGTIRTFQVEEAGEVFIREFKRILECETELYHCRYEIIRLNKPLYEVYNNEDCSRIAKRAVKRCLGEEPLVCAQPWMASESMNMLLKLYPGVLAFVGIRNEKLGSGANHHTPEFDVDERGLISGTAAAVAFAIEFLENREPVRFERNIISLEDLVNRSI